MVFRYRDSGDVYSDEHDKFNEIEIQSGYSMVMVMEMGWGLN